MDRNDFPRTWTEIDLGALTSNLALFRQALGGRPAEVAIVVKADAYGHGLVPISRTAIRSGQAQWVAVATVSEGVALAEAGLECPILVLSPILPVEAEQVVFYGLRCMVESGETAEALSRAASAMTSKAVVHIKVDTGLSRFGVMPDEVVDFARYISRLPGVELEGISQHLASPLDETVSRFQAVKFFRALAELESASFHLRWVHSTNGSASVLWPEIRTNLVRIGLLAYGIDPDGVLPVAVPVMRWYTRVMSIRKRGPGTEVSYGGTYRTTSDTKIATLGVGYGDGYPRALSNKGFVVVQGVRCPVIGMVCMDQTLVDVSRCPNPQVGDNAELFGENVLVSELARFLDTTAHELTTRVMSRVPRRFLSPPH